MYRYGKDGHWYEPESLRSCTAKTSGSKNGLIYGTVQTRPWSSCNLSQDKFWSITKVGETYNGKQATHIDLSDGSTDLDKVFNAGWGSWG